jgi:iron complex outermembrane receptor protein
MNRSTSPLARPPARNALHGAHPVHFRLSPIAAMVACMNLVGSASLVRAQEAAPVAAAPAASAAEPAPAEARALDQVVVRSRNRIEKVQDVPLSVSVISGKELDRELAYDIGGITKRAANVVRNQGNSRTFSLSVRGVGKVTQTEAQDTSVGVILDGVNLAYAPLASFDFFDVESVEVARGPQGTLLGKNSTMGVVVINTRRPSFVPDANYSLTLGQHHTVISQFAGGGPVVDDLLAWRGAVTVNKGGGAFSNNYNPDQTYYDRDRVSGRLQFLLKPTADLSARLSVDMQPKGGEYYNGQTVRTAQPAAYTNTGASTANSANDVRGKLARRWFTDSGNFDHDRDYLNNPNVNLDNQRPLITSSNGGSLEIKWDLGSHELTAVTGYRDYHFHARNDEGTPFDISKNGGGKVDAYRQQSQELRIASKAGGTVDYQAGLLFFRNTVEFGQQGWNAGWGADAGAWFANDLQYDTLDTDGNGRTLLTNSLNGLNKGQSQSIVNRSLAAFGQADWHLTPRATVTAGLRLTREDRRNTADSSIVDNGFAGVGLNPFAVNYGVAGTSTAGQVRTGGFDSVAFNQANATNGTAGNLTAAALADPAQVALADNVARRYFNVATYAALSPAQRGQIAAAKAIRASQIGTLWPLLDAARFRKTQPGFVLSPSYKFSPDQTGYVSYQYGEKGGVSQIVGGVSRLAEPEKVSSFEVGLKSAFLDKTLFINADVFLTRVKGYQQAVALPDPLNPAVTASYTGNAEKVHIHGLEVDGSYSGIPHTTVRFSGAYTEAKYKQFLYSPVPADYQTGTGLPAYRDVSGQYLTGAARFTFNIGPEFRHVVFGDKLFHTSFNAAFISGNNGDNALSGYSNVDKRWLVDASIGLGGASGKFDFSLIAKNLFRDKTPQAVTWNSYTPGDPRWIGLQFSGRV